jgi:hypothetical protein
MHKNKPYDTIHILAIDDLAQFLEFSDKSTSEGLFHLSKHGARLGVWVLCTLSTREIGSIEPYALASFRTKIFGSINNQTWLGQMAGDAGDDILELTPGRQFGIPNGTEWLKIWLCE